MVMQIMNYLLPIDEYLKGILVQILASYKILNELNDDFSGTLL